MQVPDIEGKIIKQLEKLLNSAANIHDTRKNHINSDVTYLENVSKTISNLIQSLGFKVENPFLFNTFYTLPAGIAFDEMHSTFVDITNNLNNEAIPGLKKCISQLTSSKEKMLKSIQQNMDNLRKNSNKYFENVSGIAKSRETLTLLDNIDNQFITGGQSHAAFMGLLKTISEIEAKTKQDLNEEEALFERIKNTEASIIEKTCQTISNGLPFLQDIPNKKREYNEVDEVNHWRILILQTYLELKSTHTIIPVSQRETAKRNWCTCYQMTPFYARVWEDHPKNSDQEIQLYKKETVKVLECDLGDYWLVQKPDESTGLAPCSKLQPVE